MGGHGGDIGASEEVGEGAADGGFAAVGWAPEVDYAFGGDAVDEAGSGELLEQSAVFGVGEGFLEELFPGGCCFSGVVVVGDTSGEVKFGVVF